MRLLLDTHVLIWSAQASPRLSSSDRILIDDPNSQVFFSAVSIWEVAIKAARAVRGFSLNAEALRAGLLTNGYTEFPISSRHGIRAAVLPLPHKDPFDRMLLAQALDENLILLSADAALIAYGPPVAAV